MRVCLLASKRAPCVMLAIISLASAGLANECQSAVNTSVPVGEKLVVLPGWVNGPQVHWFSAAAPQNQIAAPGRHVLGRRPIDTRPVLVRVEKLTDGVIWCLEPPARCHLSGRWHHQLARLGWFPHPLRPFRPLHWLCWC